MKFLKILIIILFVPFFIYAGDINSTLIDANQTVYKNLLKKISKKNSKNDDLLLQKILLEKLVSINTNIAKKLPIVPSPKNSEEYKILFDKFIHNAINNGILANKIKQTREKIRTLEEEIKSSKNNDISLFTLQLQDTFYNKTSLLYKKEMNILTKSINSISYILNKSVKNIKFDKKVFNKNIKFFQLNANKLKNEISELQVEKERLLLLDSSSSKIKKINDKIDTRIKEYNEFIRKAVVSNFLKFSNELGKKDKKALKTQKEILKFVHMLKYADTINKQISPLLTTMAKHYLGTINVIANSTMYGFKNILSSFWSIVTKSLFEINGSPISIMKMIISIFIFIIGFFIGGFYKVNIKKITQNISSINKTTRNIFSNLGYYIIIFLAFIFALNVLGINLSSLGLVAGALSVGIGFGLQNIVLNFISGIILMFERSIKIGDYIELSEDLRGRVTDINMRSTTINTNSNIDIIVPNENFIKNNVINWTMNDNIRRFQVPFGVSYGTKPELVEKVIKEALKKSGFTDIVNTPSRFSRIIMTGMGSSSVDFDLFVWIKGPETLYPKRTISRFLILIYNALYENKIEIPFPQQDLHIRSIDKSVKFFIKDE